RGREKEQRQRLWQERHRADLQAPQLGRRRDSPGLAIRSDLHGSGCGSALRSGLAQGQATDLEPCACAAAYKRCLQERGLARKDRGGGLDVYATCAGDEEAGTVLNRGST